MWLDMPPGPVFYHWQADGAAYKRNDLCLACWQVPLFQALKSWSRQSSESSEASLVHTMRCLKKDLS